MNRSIRVLAGGLAAGAVASGITLAGSAAYAEDGGGRPCGQPAVPAVFVTVVREPVLRLVPPVTHEEWRWEREVNTDEREFSRLIAEAHRETDWARPTLEHKWAHKVIDRAAVDAVPGTEAQGHHETVVVTPAVTVTMLEYVQQQTGRTRWENAGWNAETDQEDRGRGWTRTGNSRVDVVEDAVTKQVWVVDQPAMEGSPAIPELSHLEFAWSKTSPGSDWTGPLDSREVGAPDTTTTTGDDVPVGAGWTKTAERVVPAVVDTVWAENGPAGYTATGATRVKGVATEQTDAHSAVPPAGDGWTRIAGTLLVVEDWPAVTEPVSPGSTEQVEVSAAQPATDPCPAAAPGEVVTSPTSTAGVVSGGTLLAAPPHAGGHSAVAAAGASNAATTVLPATGSPVSPLLLTTGLGALVAGSVLVGVSRRRQTS